MTHTVQADKSSGSARLLRGTIRNLRKTRCTQDFMFTASDHRGAGATAIAAGLAGLSGIAVGLAASSMALAEEADLLEFELDGKPIRAWVWLSLFSDGDEVEIVAEPVGDGWQAYGIRRLSDKLVALHPHCSRGRYAHWKASVKWWLLLGGAVALVTLLIAIIVASFSLPLSGLPRYALFAVPGLIAALLFFGIIAFRISRKYMGFVRLAEGIFTAFGWKNVKHIDLPKITKRNKEPGVPGPLGVLFFSLLIYVIR